MILADGDTILPRHLNLSFVAAAVAARGAAIPWAHVDLSGTLGRGRPARRWRRSRGARSRGAAEADGNKGRAAELLQISYKMLLAKLKEHGIE